MPAERFTGATSRVWLALLKAGGRLSPSEVAQLVEGVDPTSVKSLLFSLSTSGAAHKYDASRPMRYGVTLHCRVPMGVTIGEILECTTAQEAE